MSAMPGNRMLEDCRALDLTDENGFLCGRILASLGVDVINPFQPEVLDVQHLLTDYRGRVTFHGGLSTQQTLPSGTTDEVREETERLLELGAAGSFVFAPAHAVVGDTPLENMTAFLDTLWSQPGYQKHRLQLK